MEKLNLRLTRKEWRVILYAMDLLDDNAGENSGKLTPIERSNRRLMRKIGKEMATDNYQDGK